MKAQNRRKRKSQPNAEILAWRRLRDFLIDNFGSVRAAAAKLKCHPNALRGIDSCPKVKKKLETLMGNNLEALL